MWTTERSIPLGRNGLIASGDLSDKAGYWGKFSGSGASLKVALAANNTGNFIITDGNTDGNSCGCHIGEVFSIAGGAMSAGDGVSSDADGKTAAPGSGEDIRGMCLENAAAAGDIVRIFVYNTGDTV